MGENSRAAGAAAVTVVLWASAFVSIRSAGGHFSPGALALGRLLVASLALGVMWLASGDGWPPRAAWPGIPAALAVQYEHEPNHMTLEGVLNRVLSPHFDLIAIGGGPKGTGRAAS